MAGQEPLWRGSGQDGQVGWGWRMPGQGYGAHETDGECQKWQLPVPGQLGRE